MPHASPQAQQLEGSLLVSTHLEPQQEPRLPASVTQEEMPEASEQSVVGPQAPPGFVIQA